MPPTESLWRVGWAPEWSCPWYGKSSKDSRSIWCRGVGVYNAMLSGLADLPVISESKWAWEISGFHWLRVEPENEARPWFWPVWFSWATWVELEKSKTLFWAFPWTDTGSWFKYCWPSPVPFQIDPLFCPWLGSVWWKEETRLIPRTKLFPVVFLKALYDRRLVLCTATTWKHCRVKQEHEHQMNET